MKKHRNPIFVGVISRVRQLLERYDESMSITHGGTKGSLREAYLKEFLADFVPHGLSISSGFITDCTGADVSPQLDLVVFDPCCLPSFALSEFATIVPLEASRLIVEVKSRLEHRDLDQIQSQQGAIRKMRFARTDLERNVLLTGDNHYLSQFVVAFETACSEQALREWFIKEPGLIAICVIKSFCLLRDPREHDVVETIQTDEHHSEVMQLISRMHTGLTVTGEKSDSIIRPDFGAYVAYDVPNSDYDA